MRIEGNDQRLAAATATQMQQSGVQQVLAPKAVQQTDAQKSSSGVENVQPLMGDKVSIKVDLPQNTVDTLQKMGNISDFLNNVAINLRQTNDGLKATSSIVADMKTSLDKIIKNYPPYTFESKERIDQLMSYSSLKKQIMNLMVPAPPLPIYENVKHLWEDLFSGPSSTIQTPTLPADAPDSHINAAAKRLDVISAQIGLVQETMGRSVIGS